MDINNRYLGIQDLDADLDIKDSMIANILKSLNWTQKSLEEELKVQCPKDSHHWIPKASLSKHLKTCTWVKEGYLKEDMDKQLPDSEFFYRNASSVVPITIDKETQYRILREKGLISNLSRTFGIPVLPKTIDRWCCELSPEQRLAIYDRIVKQSKRVKHPEFVTLEDLMIDFETRNDLDGKPKTPLEILAEQRDYKRRRQSYRAKNVHITKKSYTEVMKEVIENQISYLAETRKQESVDNNDLNKPGPSSYNDEKGSEGVKSDVLWYKKSHHEESDEDRSRSPSPKKHKHKRKRSRSRSRSHHKHKRSHKHKKYKD